MNATLLQKFIQLISDYTGLHIREQDREGLCNKIFTRLKLLKLSGPPAYYQLLETPGQASKNEWEKLILLLTVTESYFFRDKGQFQLLKNLILPEIIKQIKVSNDKSLKIWSAGCSTGEEAYSLAILVQELISDWREWNIVIWGTDINEVALAKAKQGLYSDWSFRLLDERIQKKYFYQYQGEWLLDEQVKNMVRFGNVNLVQDDFSSYFDLILCRNVFVYFESKYISLVIKKFYNSLKKGGYLMTGHAELYGQALGQFQVKVFSESLVYQRGQDWQSENYLPNNFPIFEGNIVKNDNLKSSGNDKSATSKLSSYSDFYSGINEQNLFDLKPTYSLDKNTNILQEITEKNSARQSDAQILLLEAKALFHRKAYAEAIKKAEQVISLNPENFSAYKLLAQLYANLGEYNQAIFYCNRAIEVNSLSVYPYYLLVNIAEEQGDREKAKILLKRIIYQCPLEIPAYIELAVLYEAEKDIIRAKKMKKIALELLKKLPADATVEYKGKIKVSELIKYLENV